MGERIFHAPAGHAVWLSRPYRAREDFISLFLPLLPAFAAFADFVGGRGGGELLVSFSLCTPAGFMIYKRVG